MALLSTLFCILLFFTLLAHGAILQPPDRRFLKGEPEEERKAHLMSNQERQHRSVNSEGNLKVLDFSADHDHEPDSNGEYTMATLDAGPLPESFTICSAMMVDAWTTQFESSDMVTLLDVDSYRWGWINLYAASSYTEYDVKLGPVFFIKQTESVFFPLQWSRACLSLDSVASKMTLVVDGKLLGEKEYRREKDTDRPANLSLLLGFFRDTYDFTREYTGKVTNLNVFKSSLSLKKMVRLTRAGEEECGMQIQLQKLSMQLPSKASSQTAWALLNLDQ